MFTEGNKKHTHTREERYTDVSTCLSTLAFASQISFISNSIKSTKSVQLLLLYPFFLIFYPSVSNLELELSAGDNICQQQSTETNYGNFSKFADRSKHFDFRVMQIIPQRAVAMEITAQHA